MINLLLILDHKPVTYFDGEPYFPEHTVLFKISGRSITNAFPNINLLTIDDELYYNPTVNSWLGDFLEVNSKVSGKLTTNFWCNDVNKNDPCWMKDFAQYNEETPCRFKLYDLQHSNTTNNLLKLRLVNNGVSNRNMHFGFVSDKNFS